MGIIKIYSHFILVLNLLTNENHTIKNVKIKMHDTLFLAATIFELQDLCPEEESSRKKNNQAKIKKNFWWVPNFLFFIIY